MKKCKIKKCDRIADYGKKRLCKKHYLQGYYKKNKNKLFEQMREWRENNRDKCCKYQKNYQKKNKKKLAIQRRERYLKNKYGK